MNKLFTMLLFISMLLLAFVPGIALAEDSFADMPNDYSTAALNKAIANGLLNGADGLIMPADNLTRAQMGAIIVRAFGAENMADLAAFSDTDADSWYYPELAAAVYMGIMEGSNSLMRPNDPITRQEAFVVLARAFALEAGSLEALAQFSDQDQIAAWASESVAAMVANGYVEGADGKINPQANISRKDFAVVMDRMIATYITEPGDYSELDAGSVMINVPDVTLSDITISGKLIIGDGVGEGDITLHNVTVEDDTIVRGGGADTIHITGTSSLNDIIVSKVNGVIRIHIADGVDVKFVYIEDGKDDIIIEGDVGEIIINNPVPVIVKGGKVQLITAATEDAQISLEEAEVDKVIIPTTASGTNLTVDDSSSITKVEAAGEGSNIEGAGQVGQVSVTGNDISIDTPGTQVDVAQGITGTQAEGEAVEGGTSITTAKPSSGGSSGSSGGGGGGDTGTPTFTYNVVIESSEGGRATSDITGTNRVGSTAKITAEPLEGYIVAKVLATDPDGKTIELNESGIFGIPIISSNYAKAREYRLSLQQAGTYTIKVEFIKPLKSMEVFVVNDAESYKRLSDLGIEAAWPENPSYIDDLAINPWLAVIVKRHENYLPTNDNEDNIYNKVYFQETSVYRNGVLLNKPFSGNDTYGNAFSAYIGPAPANDSTGHSFKQDSLSGIYGVHIEFQGATYYEEVSYTHPDETVYNVDLINGLTNDKIKSFIITGEDTITLPSADELPQMEGYIFQGWSKENEETLLDITGNIPINSAATFTAQYLPITEQIVTFKTDKVAAYAEAGISLANNTITLDHTRFMAWLGEQANPPDALSKLLVLNDNGETLLCVEMQMTAPAGAYSVETVSGTGLSNEEADNLVEDGIVSFTIDIMEASTRPLNDFTENEIYTWFNGPLGDAIEGKLIAATEQTLSFRTINSPISHTAKTPSDLTIALAAGIETVHLGADIDMGDTALVISAGTTLNVANYTLTINNLDDSHYVAGILNISGGKVVSGDRFTGDGEINISGSGKLQMEQQYFDQSAPIFSIAGANSMLSWDNTGEFDELITIFIGSGGIIELSNDAMLTYDIAPDRIEGGDEDEGGGISPAASYSAEATYTLQKGTATIKKSYSTNKNFIIDAGAVLALDITSGEGDAAANELSFTSANITNNGILSVQVGSTLDLLAASELPTEQTGQYIINGKVDGSSYSGSFDFENTDARVVFNHGSLWYKNGKPYLSTDTNDANQEEGDIILGQGVSLIFEDGAYSLAAAPMSPVALYVRGDVTFNKPIHLEESYIINVFVGGHLTLNAALTGNGRLDGDMPGVDEYEVARLTIGEKGSVEWLNLAPGKYEYARDESTQTGSWQTYQPKE